jgi:hypothetical protein
MKVDGDTQGKEARHEPVMIQESKAYPDERAHEIQAEQVSFNEFFASMRHPCTPYATHIDIGLPT